MFKRYNRFRRAAHKVAGQPSGGEPEKLAFKQDYFKNCHRTYSCIYCRAHLANHDELISKQFQGNHGRAYLFNKVVNIGCKQAVQRELLTGLHAVADIYCDNCQRTLGWKYEQAFVASQKYKEGKYIIEHAHMLKENHWDLTSYNARELLHEEQDKLSSRLAAHPDRSAAAFKVGNIYIGASNYDFGSTGAAGSSSSLGAPSAAAATLVLADGSKLPARVVSAYDLSVVAPAEVATTADLRRPSEEGAAEGANAVPSPHAASMAAANNHDDQPLEPHHQMTRKKPGGRDEMPGMVCIDMVQCSLSDLTIPTIGDASLGQALAASDGRPSRDHHHHHHHNHYHQLHPTTHGGNSSSSQHQQQHSTSLTAPPRPSSLCSLASRGSQSDLSSSPASSSYPISAGSSSESTAATQGPSGSP